MKPLLIILLFIMSLGQIFAQDDKNYTYIVGGQVSIGNQTNTESDRKNFSLYTAPMFGYVINPKNVVGLRAGLLYRFGQANVENKSENARYDIAPFYRRYVWTKGNMSLYGETAVSYSFGSNTNTLSNNQSKQTFSSVGFRIGPGFEYKISDQWFLNFIWATFEYNAYFYSNTDNDVHQWNLGASLDNISWGINYRF